MEASSIDFKNIIGPVAIKVLNCQPNKTLSSTTELRFGNRGAFCVDLTNGTWCDHSDGDRGGGVLDLLKLKMGLEKPSAMQWLRDNRLISAQPNIINIVYSYDYTDPAESFFFKYADLIRKIFASAAPIAQHRAAGFGKLSA